MHALYFFLFFSNAGRTSHRNTISAQQISVYGSKLPFISNTRISKLISNSLCTVNAEEEKITRHYKAKLDPLKAEKCCLSVSQLNNSWTEE